MTWLPSGFSNSGGKNEISSIFLLIGLSTSVGFAQKLNAEEIVTKHIEAIGGAEKLAEAKSRAAAGTANFRSKLPNRQTDGRSVIASDEKNVMFFMQLNS